MKSGHDFMISYQLSSSPVSSHVVDHVPSPRIEYLMNMFNIQICRYDDMFSTMLQTQ